MENIYRLIWSEEAINNLKGIIEDLEHKWTRREIKKFAKLLDKQLIVIKSNPYLFAESEKSNGLRKAVLSRQTTIYYRIKDDEIRIITLFDNRQNPEDLLNK
ncbi:type II toxin-antitoxin system RelE/ParE family toxin [Plebeiibacterium sediminum]|uniref:Type II toxin-antitoxin system RelE/ParE family toxin n=1 Tax=Plebeiibacterium sediminum TaxID=2992112 RepID=A0AAE3MAI0_9BACT|nr:type II toxin-antitoxin system RelE/ParE family toxin [Plebeiobacterium sediminum]MCW3789770.1 type II toxin-antitoxin system RelE/ParE family toxin [Plebeiobacterium sediminum]